MAKLIFGCGYLGHRVARLWRQQGHHVLAVTRSAERAQQFAAQNIGPIVGNIVAASSLGEIRKLADIDTVAFAVGFDRSSCDSIEQVYVDGLRNALAVLPSCVQRVIYISSTGVYGQTESDWVDEESPCRPLREGGKACLEAEQVLFESPFGTQAVVLRLAGIYGPDRIPRAKDILTGTPLPAASEGYMNLIHVDDAAQIVLHAEHRCATPRLFCIADDAPVMRSEYYGELARLLGAAAPTFVDPPAGSAAAQRAQSDKRISNARMTAELQPQLLYPSYREGLAAILRQQHRVS